MPKFIIRDTLPCYVTWTYEIEADSEDDAMDKFMDGDHDTPKEPEIGDNISWIDGTTSCDPA